MTKGNLEIIHEMYNLKFGEWVHHQDKMITRVPGGWIYEIFGGDGFNTVFIPFNNEFQQQKIKSDEKN